VKGATQALIGEFHLVAVSIHAPVKGATKHGSSQTPTPRSFDPRARERRDEIPEDGAHPIVKVSIHAPVKGATSWHVPCFSAQLVSIHAPVKGATT